MEDKIEVTGIPLWIVLQSLYDSRRRHWNHQPNTITPAVILRLMSIVSPPTEADFKSETDSNSRGYPSIPDYMAGSPMKVTTEFYRDDLTRVWYGHPEATRCFIGRLDLYERDNGTAALNKFTTKIMELKNG